MVVYIFNIFSKFIINTLQLKQTSQDYCLEGLGQFVLAVDFYTFEVDPGVTSGCIFASFSNENNKVQIS